MEFSLEPCERKAKPWAAVVRLTPAMLACLKGQPGAASITLSATDNVRPNTHTKFFGFFFLFSTQRRRPPRRTVSPPLVCEFSPTTKHPTAQTLQSPPRPRLPPL